jgi:hypothetical protein
MRFDRRFLINALFTSNTFEFGGSPSSVLPSFYCNSPAKGTTIQAKAAGGTSVPPCFRPVTKKEDNLEWRTAKNVIPEQAEEESRITWPGVRHFHVYFLDAPSNRRGP